MYEAYECDGRHLFGFDNDYIRELVPFDLDDEECDGVVEMLEENFGRFVTTWTREWRIDHPAKHDGWPVTGTLIRQEWANDYAITVGYTEFDCFLALDCYKLSELPPYADDFHGRGCLNYGDELYWKSVSLGLVPDWGGPFEMYVDDEEYEAYMDERVLREYGYEVRGDE